MEGNPLIGTVPGSVADCMSGWAESQLKWEGGKACLCVCLCAWGGNGRVSRSANFLIQFSVQKLRTPEHTLKTVQTSTKLSYYFPETYNKAQHVGRPHCSSVQPVFYVLQIHITSSIKATVIEPHIKHATYKIMRVV